MITDGDRIIKYIHDYGLESVQLHSAYITDAGNIRLVFEIPRNFYGSPSRLTVEEEEEARHTGTLKWIELEPIRRS